MKKLTIKELLSLKGKRQITCTTCHDFFTAKACNEAGIDVFVTSGEFIRQYIAGDFVRTNETIADLLTVLEGVRKGAPDVFIYAAIPHGSANVSDAVAIESAQEALRNGADAIYFSGLTHERIKKLAAEKIPVFGHAGMIPWFSTWYGGTRAVGKTAKEAIEVYEQALRMQEAGCIAIELECVPHEVASEISKRLDIIVISMGSGYGCDGQYVFSQDMMGLHDLHYPRHAVVYENYFEKTVSVMKQFTGDVSSGRIEKKQKTINIDKEEFELFMKNIG